MPHTEYRGRRAVTLENDLVAATVTVEGGHLAAITDKASGVNPLWSPPWPTIEPSQYDAAKHLEYGADAESKLLAGILGHNLCLDLFGGPSEEEARAGITVHGEGSVVPYEVTEKDGVLVQRALLPQSQLLFARTIRLQPDSRVFEIAEEVDNLSAWDRPVAWTQHVTLGPPFLENGRTEFQVSATKSKVIETDFTGGKGFQKIGAEFNWPMVPTTNRGLEDLRIFTGRPVSGGYTAHLMDPAIEDSFFLAWSPTHKLLLGYVWKRSDFPWMGIWEENHARTIPPWNGEALTRGMEFGVSPFAESRKAMIERGSLFGVPGYRWLPARSRTTVSYKAFLVPADSCPDAPPYS